MTVGDARRDSGGDGGIRTLDTPWQRI